MKCNILSSGLKNILIIVIISFNSSCINTGSDHEMARNFQITGDSLFVISSQSNDTVDSIQYKDGKRNGWSKSYQDGVLKNNICYIDGKKNGWEKSYYRNGSIEFQGVNKNGVKDSTWIWYFKNGVIERKASFLENDNPFGMEFNYYRNGLLKNFYFHKIGGTIVYWRTLSKDNKKVEEERGFPIQEAYNRDNFKKGDTFELILIMGILPDWKVNLSVTDWRNGTRQKLISNLQEDNFEKLNFGNRAIIKKKCEKQGNFKWVIKASIFDKKYKRRINYNDTLSFSVR
ncbi:MAG TPA: hypothetical protein VFL76_10285 [Edaphocola sp.]|nr:hypothetical protein [Edaphocola sp.]